MFRVKICGITNEEDARAAATAGADAVGLNFYQESPRFLSPASAEAVVRALPAEVVKVGLFVNSPAEAVIATFRALGLDLVQIHGDEPPEYLAAMGDRPVMRALRLGPLGLAPILEYLENCRRLGCLPRWVLIDAYRPGRYGGTGATCDWTVVQKYPAAPWHPPLVLAGGLTAENVAEAIHRVRPSAVDTAGGVETSPGKKDAGLVRQFIQNARRAFESLR